MKYILEKFIPLILAPFFPTLPLGLSPSPFPKFLFCSVLLIVPFTDSLAGLMRPQVWAKTAFWQVIWVLSFRISELRTPCRFHPGARSSSLLSLNTSKGGKDFVGSPWSVRKSMMEKDSPNCRLFEQAASEGGASPGGKCFWSMKSHPHVSCLPQLTLHGQAHCLLHFFKTWARAEKMNSS